MTKKKVIIIGAVAAGTSAAAKLRRLSEDIEITIYEKDRYISYASCGLPYFVSGRISSMEDLLVNSVDSFSKRFDLNIKIMHEVTEINPEEKFLKIRDMTSGDEFDDYFDYLLITTGTNPSGLPFFKNEKNICYLKTIEDAVILRDFIDLLIKENSSDNEEESKKTGINSHGSKEAVGNVSDKKEITANALIIGAGFIGLELLEAFSNKKLDTVIIEKTSQILPNFDTEVTDYAEDYLNRKGITILKNCDIVSYSADSRQRIISIHTSGGLTIKPDLVFMGIGVRPENRLAGNCGIKTGERGGIIVDENLKTGFDYIYAAGDCVEVNDLLSEQNKIFCLASIASKQGRIAAKNIFDDIKQAGKIIKNPSGPAGKYSFKGSIGTSIIKIFDLQIGKTGLSFKESKKINKNTARIEMHFPSHAGYYPGAEMIHVVTIFDKVTGKILGFEAVGKESVDKKTDIMAVSILNKADIRSLAKYELAYHPSCGAAKDSINIIGMIAENLFDGEVEFIDCEDLKTIIEDKKSAKDYQIVDVRNPGEFKAGHIEGAVLMPLNTLRGSLEKLDKTRKTVVYCKTGYRAYVAYKMLKNYGFADVKCLNGSYLSWKREQFL